MAWTAPLYRIYERRLSSGLDVGHLPAHIGVILDGHRRYARAEGLVEYRESYEIGMAKLREFLGWCAQLQVPAVTAWVLSTDNLNRPADELEPYYAVLIELLESLPELARHLGFVLHIIGSVDQLPPHLARAAKEAQERCDSGSWHFNLALGYGGRQEIVDACRSLIGELAANGLALPDLADHINVASLSRHVYTAAMPDPDLVIRTSGEARLSGFLLWQSAYAECVFVDPYWPAFRRVDFFRALRDYARRERRFGR
jgi:short-chain Z-isoprenyl diphosphate synthase